MGSYGCESGGIGSPSTKLVRPTNIEAIYRRKSTQSKELISLSTKALPHLLLMTADTRSRGSTDNNLIKISVTG